MENVFERGEGFREVFGDAGGNDLDFVEADLMVAFSKVLGECQSVWGITDASNCFRRGDAEARIILLSRKKLNAGSSRGGGSRSGPGDLTWGGFGDVWEETSYEGGGSVGIGEGLRSAMVGRYWGG